MNLATQIAMGHHDSDLDAIHYAAADRRAVLRRQRGSAVLASVLRGDRVRLSHDCRPKYIAGAVGVVKKVVGDKVVIDLDQPHYGPTRRHGMPGKRWQNDIRTPASLVVKI